MKFNLHIEDSVSALIDLYSSFTDKYGLEKSDEHIKQLVDYKIRYFKSDLIFKWHPLFFNLYILDRFLKKLKVSVQLNDLVPMKFSIRERIASLPLSPDELFEAEPSQKEAVESSNKYMEFYKMVQTFHNPS
jgi:hypothetical protein